MKLSLSTLSRQRELVLALLLVLLLAGIGLRSPVFITPQSLNNVLSDTAILVILAVAQTMVILSRGIDLSVAANLALSGMGVALFCKYGFDIGAPASIALAIIIGGLLGCLNAIAIALLGLPSIVVTLGTMSVFRGSIYILTGGGSVSQNEMTPTFLKFPLERFLGLTNLVWIALFVSIVGIVVMRFTTFGRNLYAIGSNPLAARYAGINVRSTQFTVYVISGCLAGLCGYLWVARYAIAFTEVALGFELSVIAACVVGGVSIAGGVGTVTGSIIGALLLGVVANSLPVLRISPFWQMAVVGAIIIGSVVLNARAAGLPRKQIIPVHLQEAPLSSQLTLEKATK